MKGWLWVGSEYINPDHIVRISIRPDRVEVATTEIVQDGGAQTAEFWYMGDEAEQVIAWVRASGRIA